ncbi:cytochrome b/b6 domain-containing protein [Shewanella yunxiaonensis]|uniref:Cytochrome b/b6 domain-containing protein n=1 Tax=Shewanella yunxiaonensis TaxID=2829809 RepID=A0ABX7YQ83_9GAMM|nr:cytochrome b/b6 domain-containing protein [Shewanella yunxiaonensis]QUN04923.1 cytochrome b/b6 domain-containing protein [Shewanella yunxiaonensis]
MTQKMMVWDVPVRFFHWLTLLLVALLWWSAEQGEMQWHQLFAYLLMINLLLRIVWGFIGSQYARFSDFLRSPFQVISYVRKQPDEPSLGHNPLGGYMVLALILVLLLQVSSGMFATDDIVTEGPFYSWVSDDLSRWLTWLHKSNFNLLLVLVVIHVSAVVFYEIRGQRLIAAMVTGNKQTTLVSVSQQGNVTLKRWLWVMLLISAPIGYWLIWPLLATL